MFVSKFSLIFLKIEFAALVEINWEITIPTKLSNWFSILGLKIMWPLLSIIFLSFLS